MAAFTGTPFDSIHLDAQQATNREVGSKNSAQELKVVRFATYTHLAAQGAGTGTVRLGMLPPGQITIYPALSRLVTSQFAANADIHIGYAAHVNTAGAAVSASTNAFLDNGDAGGGALDSALTGNPTEMDSISGIVMEAMIDTGNIETDDTISLSIVYSQN